ncbi:hypothetical protein [uncultured Pseudoalteromonas sp.]|uniref:hypothetical protein n=1 Tax=uncultured Pseudoalteromonas sp. TaxID=114053 RepID=UPI0030C7C1F1
MSNKFTSAILVLISLLLFIKPSHAEPVFAIKASIYKFQNEINVDSKIEQALKNLSPTHQPQLLTLLNKSAMIEIGDDTQMTALEVKPNAEGTHFNASLKLKEQVDGKWESISSFMPQIPNGQTVYLSRTFTDSVWVIKLTGKRYESIALGQASL